MLKRIKVKIKEYLKLRSLGYKGFRFGWKKGFCKDTLSVCGITKDNYKDFLCDKDYFLGHPWNGAYSGIIDNKLYLPLLLEKYKEYVPEYYYFKDEYGFLPLNKKGHVRVSIDDFLELLHKETMLCLKHTHSSVGQGFMLCKYSKGCYYINKELIDKDKFVSIVSSLKEYIVTEYIQQHDYAKEINSTSLNTIRFLCAWDYKKCSFFVARCFHRFGCNGNIVDNVGSGNGMLVFVNPETGVLKKNGAINQNHSGDRFAEDIIHPDSNRILTNLQIPNFENVRNKIIEIANSISYLRWVGFDVAITADSFKIIEVNSLSSLIDQECCGYLTDDRLCHLFRKS